MRTLREPVRGLFGGVFVKFVGNRIADAKRLPLNMLDALRALGESSTIKSRLGEFVPSYLKLKHEEWKSYCRHLTQWERDATLDC